MEVAAGAVDEAADAAALAHAAVREVEARVQQEASARKQAAEDTAARARAACMTGW